MDAETKGSLNNHILRPRPRSEFTSGYNSRRPVTRPRTALISDVIQRRYSVPTSSTSSRVTSQPTIPIRQQDVALSPSHEPISEPLTQNKASKSPKKHLKVKNKRKLQVALLVLAGSIVLAGGYVSFLGLRANHIAVVQAEVLTHQANSNSSHSSAPSTIKPSAATIANYVVAPNLPRYIIIPKLGIKARVQSVGVNSQGALQTPSNVYDTAWYNESSEPGQQGAMLIDGHVSSWTTHGIFYGIKTLVAGDIIKIERGDDTIFTYKVVKNQVYPSGNVNMTSAMTPIVVGQPGLNLISCTGDVIPGTSQFNERILVYATLVG